jgi:hypothetical protein
MKPIVDRVIDRAAELLVDRMLDAVGPPNAVTNRPPPTSRKGNGAKCPQCGFVAKNLRGLDTHIGHKHKDVATG